MILHTIAEKRDSLTRSERRIADWLLASADVGADLRISDVATASQVSEPTVLRFARNIGFSGFRAFRGAWLGAAQSAGGYLHQDITPGDSTLEAASKVMDSCISELITAKKLLQGQPLDEAVSMMIAARQIIFCGLGASGHVAADAQHKFFRLGMPCTTALDPQTILQHASVAESKDVLVVISNTGNWPEILSAAEIAGNQGSQVISLTEPNSPLAAIAHCVLACPSKEDTSSYTPMNSRLVHLALLDSLQIALALKMGERAAVKLRQSKSVLNTIRPRGDATSTRPA